MTTTTKVPAITATNIASDAKISTAVAVAEESDKRNEMTKSDSALFLYAVVMFTDRKAKELADTFGAKAPAISKARKVVTYYVDTLYPDRETTFTTEDYNDVAEEIRRTHGNIFAAYRDLFPTVRAEKSLMDLLRHLYKTHDVDADTFGALALGVAQEEDAKAEGDDDEEDDDQ